ncbi:hypothetical protein NL108_018607 [Boleophthalmus pectinirostris]|nr:hypothetical protein NL108_018607 [Boleophthalmus pectinirostris]
MKLLIQQQLLQLLQLLLLLQYSCAQDFHGDVQIDACSDSDGEGMVGLDGDVLYYADFDKKEMVYTLPQFGDSMECPGCYEGAVGQQENCKSNMQIAREAMKDIPLEIDPPGAPLLYPRDHLKPSHHNTLVCQASGFYPAPVRFYWTKDGQNVSLSASVSQSLSSERWNLHPVLQTGHHPRGGTSVQLCPGPPRPEGGDQEQDLDGGVPEALSSALCLLCCGSDSGAGGRGRRDLLPGQRERVLLIGRLL